MPAAKKKRSGCGKKSTKKATTKGKQKTELDELSLKILKGLKEINKPAKCGEIAKHIGEDVRRVMGKLRSLKTKGLVEQPEKGYYKITTEGKKLV